MAVAFVQEFKLVDDDRTTTTYDAVGERVRDAGPIKGLIVHTAGFDEDAGVFRIFDVWKPGPIRRIQDLPDGLGIMIDDVLAGLLAAGVTVLLAGALGP